MKKLSSPKFGLVNQWSLTLLNLPDPIEFAADPAQVLSEEKASFE